MIEINGAAGGQVLRTALGFSALLKKPVKISNIRANRPNPGLQAQHLTGIRALQELADAGVKGASKGSSEVIFGPGELRALQLNVNIGTAGSIMLLLQSILLPSLLNGTKLRVIGGTDVSWSPPFNYMKHVLLPVLAKMGAKYELDLNSRGYYPRGMGRVSFRSIPQKLPLNPIDLTKIGALASINLFSHSASLPKEVSLNQATSAKKALQGLGVDVLKKIEWKEKSETIGSGIDLIAKYPNGVKIAANALGARGKPAVKVGEEAAEKLLKEIKPGSPVDSHLADQLIPFMAIANGESKIRCACLTEHTVNNIKVTEKFTETKFNIAGEKGKQATITVKGTGFRNG